MIERFEIDELAEPSQDFARQLLARFLHVRHYCSMETRSIGKWEEGQWGFYEVPGLHLKVDIPSPAGNDRDVEIWMEDECGDEPSIGFGAGGWHLHGTYLREWGDWREESIIDVLDAIFKDEFVCIEDRGWGWDAPGPFRDTLDFRDPSALVELLTDPFCSGQMSIKTFTGKGDRVVSLDDIEG